MENNNRKETNSKEEDNKGNITEKGKNGEIETKIPKLPDINIPEIPKINMPNKWQSSIFSLFAGSRKK